MYFKLYAIELVSSSSYIASPVVKAVTIVEISIPKDQSITGRDNDSIQERG